MRLEVAEPSEAAGIYIGGGSTFYSGCANATAEVAIATDDSTLPNLACGAITSDVADKIAVIDRGECFFEEKALNAQSAGAIALIICNNNPASDTENGGAFTMADVEEVTDPINIPVIGLSMEDCAILKAALPLTASINNFWFLPSNDPVVLWGGVGQGDFSDGAQGWTTEGTDCNGSPSDFEAWQWKENGAADQGSFSGPSAITSPTGCTGAMLFDSDFHDTNGDATGGNNDPAFGSGPCPAIQIGSLVSPPIDLSGVTDGGVSLTFYQDVRQFSSEFYVGYSIDGGTTWTETQINDEIELNADVDFINTYKTIPLAGAAGVSDVRVRFRMVGDYYYWVIDDVKITEGFKNELVINDFFFTPASAAQPASQVQYDPFLFQVLVANEGSEPQTNVVFRADIVELLIDAEGNLLGEDILYSDSTVFDVIDVGIDTALSITDLYSPELEPGSYIIRYSVSQDGGDENAINNIEETAFVVTSNTFSKDLDGGNELARRGNDEKHAYANIYSIAAETQEIFVLGNIGFRSFLPEEEGILDGNVVNVYLMEVADDVEDGYGNFNITSSDITAEGQLSFIGFTEFTYPNGAGSGAADFFEAQLEDFDSGASNIKLKPGSRYFAMTEYPTQSAHIYQIYSTEINYTFTSSLLLYERWFNGFQGQNGFAPVIRMDLALSTAVDETPLPDNAMLIAPNPATDYVSAQFDLEKSLEATVTLATMDGKVIEYKNLPLFKETVEFNTANLAEGMYLLRVATEEGTQTKKFLVQRP